MFQIVYFWIVVGVKEEVVLVKIDVAPRISKEPADHLIRNEKQQTAPDLLTTEMLLLRREPVPCHLTRDRLHPSQQWKVPETPPQRLKSWLHQHDRRFR